MKLNEIDLKTVWLNESINWQELERAGISKGFILDEDGKLMVSLNKNYSISPKDIKSGMHYFLFTNGKGQFLVFKEFNH